MKEISAEYRSAQKVDDCPVGYRKTDIGIIPSEWEVVELGEAAIFLDGLRKPVKSGDRAKMKGIYRYYGASGVVDYVNDYLFEGSYILLGEDGENILSRNLPLAFRVDGKFWVNNHAHVMQPKNDFDIDYLTGFLESLDYTLLNSGTAQPKLNKKSCLAIKVAKPSKKEQTAIANALSDVDALITSLERLITKKRDIKTAAMQQLLTGKKRLPPFDKTHTGYKQTELGEIPEDWEIVELGSISHIKTGSRNNQDKIPDGAYPFYVRSQNVERINSYSYDCEAILVPGEGNIGNIFHYVNGRFDAHQRVYVIRNFAEDVSAKYIFYYMKVWFGNHAMENSVKATVDSLRLPTFLGFRVIKPVKNEEQCVIAGVLSDMDKELDALEQRLAKTQQLKQGMMQELLTGKMRLV